MDEIGRKRIGLYGSVPHLFIDHYGYSEAIEVGKELKTRGFQVDTLIPAGYGYSIFAEQGTEHFKMSGAYYCNCIRACKYIGTDLVCIRPQNGFLSQEPKELIGNATAMLEIILHIAQEENVRIALGTNLVNETSDLHKMEELHDLISAINNPYLGVLLDTHVISMAGETIEDWVTVFGEKIFCAHIADGRENGYRPWGRGVYPMEDYIRKLPAHESKARYVCFLPGKQEAPEQTDKIHMQMILKAEKGDS